MRIIGESTKRASKSVWRCIVHYIYGMFATSFNSSITAMDAVIGLSVGAAATPDIMKPNWKAAVAVFGVCFLRSCLMYFKDHKLPEKLPETAAPFPTTK